MIRDFQRERGKLLIYGAGTDAAAKVLETLKVYWAVGYKPIKSRS